VQCCALTLLTITVVTNDVIEIANTDAHTDEAVDGNYILHLEDVTRLHCSESPCGTLQLRVGLSVGG